MTLGMTGRFLSQKEAQQHPHVRWHLELYNTTSHQHTKIYYADVRNFGTLKFCLSRQALLEKLQSLGPDILSSCTQEDFVNILSNCRPRQNICKILMDQSKISGIGNYILSECLYRASIDPFCSVSELTVEQQTTLFREASHVARESYESQLENDNDKQPFEYQVYGQQVCKQRGESVIRDTNGPHGRTIWYTQSQLFQPLVQQQSLASLAETKGNGQQLQTPLEDPTLPRASRNSVSRRTRSAAATAPTPGNAKLAAILSGSNSDESIPTQLATSSASAATNPTIATRTTKPKQLAQELLLDTITDPDWKSALRDELLDLPSFQSVVEFLEQEQASGATVYPPQKQIFAALNLCPLDEVRVVIVGQDPYHGRGQGHGLAFSVQKGVRAPPSLQNIFKEAVEDVGIETPQHGNLEHWARQGVLLLNTVLTVQEGKALSHKGKGWEQVTDAIIRSIAARNECADSSSLVFLLWGNAAFQKVASAIGKESGHHIVRCSHPSPLGATKTNRPFLGSKCFSRTNKALLDMGKDPIDWNVE